MPARGSVKKRPPSIQLITKDIIKQYSKATGRKDIKRFKEIAHALFELMAKYVIEDEEGFKLPYNLGILIVKRFTPRRKAVNRRRTAIMGETVYFHNLHSFGDMITTTWIKPEYIKYRNLKAFCFKADREVRRAASKACLAGKVYKKIDSRDQYAREMIALDNIQEQYDDKLNKQQYR